MKDIILKVRLGIDDTKKNKKRIVEFSEWLNQNYLEHGFKFIDSILKAAKIPFDGYKTTKIEYSESHDPYISLRHPKLGSEKKWFLDEIKMRNNKMVWIKLENQWIKGKIVINKKSSAIVIEPENVVIPITEDLFLKW